MPRVPDWVNISATLAPVTAAAAIGCASLFDPAYLIPLGGFVALSVSTGIVKAGAVRILPKSITTRPATTGWITADGQPTGCGLFPRYGEPRAEQSGFPSGHASQMFFVAAFFSMLLVARGGDFVAPRVALIFAVAAAVAAQRVASSCHTVAQVAAGAAFGAAFGAATYFAASAWAPATFQAYNAHQKNASAT